MNHCILLLVLVLLTNTGLGMYQKRRQKDIGIKWHLINIIWMSVVVLLIPALPSTVLLTFLNAYLNFFSTEQFLLEKNTRFNREGYVKYWVSILLLTLFNLLWVAIIGNLIIACIVSYTLYLLVCLLDHHVLQARGSEIEVEDIVAIPTALRVAGNYPWRWSAPIGMTVVAAILHEIFVGQLAFYHIEKYSEYHLDRFLIGSIAIAGLLFILGPGLSLLKVDTYYEFENYDGLLMHWVLNLRMRFKDALDNKTHYEETNLSGQDEEIGEWNPPCHVIFVMNESFSDLRVWNEQLLTKPNFMSFFDSHQDEFCRVRAISSVLGGNTVYSEAEILSGLTARAFDHMPYSSIYMKHGMQAESYVSYLKKLGFYTVAIHSFEKTCWRRQSAYRALGFDQQIFIDEFKSKEPFGKYCSDRSHYQESFRRLQQKKDGKKQFQFNITMQNHGGYEELAETCVDCNFKQQDLINYLSLINESNQAIEEYLDILKRFEEPVLVCFVGDHQPRLCNETMEALTGNKYIEEGLQRSIQQYEVPMYYWINPAAKTGINLTDLKKYQDQQISINYSMFLLLKALHAPKNKLMQYLEQLLNELPVISKYHVSGKDGQEGITSEQAALLAEYEQICRTKIKKGDW